MRRSPILNSDDTTKKGITPKQSLQNYAAAEERERRLRETAERLARQLGDAKHRSRELIAAVERAVDAAAAGLMIPPVPTPRISSRKVHTEEQAIICVGDLQLAKVTPTYNTKVCERRMQSYAESIRSITEIQRSDHPVRDARVYLLGDILEGELIFPHQPYQIDASLFTQLMVDGPRITINFLRTLLTFFRKVHVVAIPGNHGELGGITRRAYSPESNADRMLYRHVQQALASEPRLSWAIPYQRNESAWYAVDYPFAPSLEHGVLIFHGQQIPNPGSASTGTIARRIWGYASGGVAEPFENVIFAHWHTPKYIPLNRIEVWCNGSTESTNIYAQERLSAIGQPIQLLMFCHPKRGMTAQYWIKLEKQPVIAPQAYHLPTPEIYLPVPPPRGL